MNVAPLQMILPAAAKAGAERPEADGVNSFGEVLGKALNNVNTAQLKANETTKQFLTGEIQDVHQVTIAAEQARIMMQLAVEVRNKVVEAYQEMSRMQV
ncbi:MAG: flagellar hook-basal body protein FliE [Peptococcaceae bacterium BICA1-7]|nr:MAG: flagellar hook-basal body protein FliE [Peptococcaceae bacterium BICA1-7]HBV96600.1 flagellar hook-basal body complex protein FliE [Desulfotomaculum sp.]